MQVLSYLCSSPLLLAAGFSILATGSSVIAAYVEGRLVEFQQASSATGAPIAVVPFIRNFSTLIDFALLNPLVIFFLQRSRCQVRAIDTRLDVKWTIPLYHRVGLIVLFVIIGIYAMRFYVDGSHFYDATFVPGDQGQPKITITGWIVYSWTALYIAWLLFAAMEHGLHVARVIRLRPIDIPYSPFHPDGAGGVRFLMEPSISAGYAMIGLLATFAIFVIHDRVLYHIDSNRLLGFVLYIVVVVPMFGLPLCKLHQLMKVRRNEYLFDALDRNFSNVSKVNDSSKWSGLADYMSAIETADKYRKIVCAFPVWPIPFVLTVPPIGSVAAAAVPLVQKIISSSGIVISFPG